MGGLRKASARAPRKQGHLLPKREVLRRANLSKAQLDVLIRAHGFPPEVLPGRWDPRAVEVWLSQRQRHAADGGR